MEAEAEFEAEAEAQVDEEAAVAVETDVEAGQDRSIFGRETCKRSFSSWSLSNLISMVRGRVRLVVVAWRCKKSHIVAAYATTCE